MTTLTDYVMDFWNDTDTARLPVYETFQGVEDEGVYNSLCRFIKERTEENKNRTILIENACAFTPDMNILREIKKDLPTMNLDNITSRDLVMFPDNERNSIFLGALNATYQRAKQEDNLYTRKKQENFICAQIVLAVNYLLSINLDLQKSNKMVYYNMAGNQMERRDYWFIQLGYAMGMDVLFLDPYGNRIEPNKESFQNRVAKGKPLGKVKTRTSTYSAELESKLFTDSGSFKPWMFQGGQMTSVMLDGVLEDILVFWNQESRMREGFQADVRTKSITVPVFFAEVDGVYTNKSEYLKLLEKIQEGKYCHVTHKAKDLFGEEIPKAEAVKVVFEMQPKGNFKYESLAGYDYYCLKQMTQEAGEFVIQKLNEFMDRKSLSKDDRVSTVNTVLNMSKPIARLFENYDLPFAVPKIVFFLDNEEKVNQKTAILFEYLSFAGFDIILFSPAGDSGMRNTSHSKFRLDEKIFDVTWDKLKQNKKTQEKTEETTLKRFFKAFKVLI